MMTSMIMSIVPLLVMAAVYVWFGLTMGKLFVQLGVESWKAWVPIINQLEMLRLVGRPSSQIIIIALIPLYGLYVYYQVLQEMTRLCGRNESLALLGLLLPPVWAVKMTDTGTSTRGAVTTTGASVPPPPQRVPRQIGGTVPGPTPPSDGLPAAVAPPAYVPQGYQQPAAPAPVPAPRLADPVAPVVPAGPPSAAQAVARPAGADPTVSSSAWSAAPVLPVQDAAPSPVTQAPAAPSRPAVQPPRMPVQPAPAPAQPTSYPVAAPAPVQPTPQPSVVAPPVRLVATPPASVQPPPRAVAPAIPEAAPVPVRPSPQPTRPTLHAVASQAVPSDAAVERTVVLDRTAWSLLLDDGRRFDLWAPSVLIGRAPSPVGAGTQALAISDETCTISKVHARLDLVGGAWQVTDANSTNGIIVTRAGRAYTVPSGGSATVDEQLVLGSVGMRLAAGQ